MGWAAASIKTFLQPVVGIDILSAKQCDYCITLEPDGEIIENKLSSGARVKPWDKSWVK